MPVSYLILLQVGFALPLNLTVQSGGLLHRRFTLTPRRANAARGGLFLWHYPFLSINRKTSRHYTGTPYPAESGLSSPHAPSRSSRLLKESGCIKTAAQSDHPPDHPRSGKRVHDYACQYKRRPQNEQVMMASARLMSWRTCGGSFIWHPPQAFLSTPTSATSLRFSITRL